MEHARMGLKLKNTYVLECHDRNGNFKWREEFYNAVVTEGLNHALNSEFKGGAQISSWYVGLKGTGSPAAGDTLASHATWSEITAYSGTRPALTLGTVSAGSVSNTASKAVFTMNGTYDCYGAFVCSAASGTSGTLYGAGDITTHRSGDSGDTITMTVTLTAASA